jgi:hypothetical protein
MDEDSIAICCHLHARHCLVATNLALYQLVVILKENFPLGFSVECALASVIPLGIFHLAICNQLSKVLVLILSRLAWIQFLLTGILTPSYQATHTTLVLIVLLMCCFVMRT